MSGDLMKTKLRLAILCSVGCQCLPARVIHKQREDPPDYPPPALTCESKVSTEKGQEGLNLNLLNVSNGLSLADDFHRHES